MHIVFHFGIYVSYISRPHVPQRDREKVAFSLLRKRRNKNEKNGKKGNVVRIEKKTVEKPVLLVQITIFSFRFLSRVRNVHFPRVILIHRHVFSRAFFFVEAKIVTF